VEEIDGKSFSLRQVSMEEICATLAYAAWEYDLPLPFVARLIWQESGFRPDAVSRAGARGIAQFMPGTAQWRGLDNPHDPIQALRKAAGYLHELRMQFGNLGLAAAAYNGGSGRVERWLNGKGFLPRETRQYVQIITGSPVEEWRDGENALAVSISRIPGELPCPVLVTAALSADPVSIELPQAQVVTRPQLLQDPNWFVVVASNPSRDRVLAQFATLQRRFSSVLKNRQPTVVTGQLPGRGRSPISVVRLDEPDRASANRLCARLRTGGASCMVVRVVGQMPSAPTSRSASR
jgi:hypothetical protein